MTSAPGYTFWLPLPFGPLREAVKTPLEFQARVQRELGDVVRLQLGPIATHFLYHPDHVTHVLRDRQRNYLRGWQYNLLRQLFGNNLVVTEGEFWRRQRRLAQPAFHQHRLAGYADTMVDTIDDMLRGWEESGENPLQLDITPVMSRLALAIAGRTLFSRDVSREADAIGTSFGTVSRFLDHRFKHPLTSFPLPIPTPRNRGFRRAKQTLVEIVRSMIAARRLEGTNRGDLLAMLMSARDEETGEQMTDEQLCIEALTFLIAGHETTAKGLAWTFYLLATHPEERHRLREEASAVLGDRRPTAADVPALTATRRAVDEALRLYPPVWVLARQAVEDDEIGGFRIRAGSSVVLSPFITHRHPEFWERPEHFLPERFAPAQAAARPRGAYFPFIAGPHQCIGHEFAVMEMVLIVASVLRRFDFELFPDPEHPIHPVAALTLNPSGPIQVAVRPVGRVRAASAK